MIEPLYLSNKWTLTGTTALGQRGWLVLANGLGELGSIPGRVIPKTKKWYLMPPYLTLSIIR